MDNGGSGSNPGTGTGSGDTTGPDSSAPSTPTPGGDAAGATDTETGLGDGSAGTAGGTESIANEEVPAGAGDASAGQTATGNPGNAAGTRTVTTSNSDSNGSYNQYAAAEMASEGMDTQEEGYAPQTRSLSELNDQLEPTLRIGDQAVPLSSGSGSMGTWALLNLIFALLSLVVAGFGMLSLLKRRESQAGTARRYKDNTKRRNSLSMRFAVAALGILAPIVFILTEDTANLMTLIDNWTWAMALIFGVQAVTLAVASRKDKEPGDNSTEAGIA
jgi:hypothetical protein